jgi:hypothetical protein
VVGVGVGVGVVVVLVVGNDSRTGSVNADP